MEQKIYVVRVREAYAENGVEDEVVTINVVACETAEQAFAHAKEYVEKEIDEIREEHNGEIPKLYTCNMIKEYDQLLDWYVYLIEAGYGRTCTFEIKIEYLDFERREDEG